MSMPYRTTLRRARLAVAVLAVAALAGACTTAGGSQRRESATSAHPRETISLPAGSPSPLPVAATAAAVEHDGLSARIHDVRVDSGGVAVLRFTIDNGGTQAFPLGRELADPNRDPAVGFDFFSCELAASGVTLIAGNLRHHPLYRSDGEHRSCLNARWGGQHAGTTVEPGHGRTLYAVYLLPGSADSVTVEIPGFEPVPGVAVQR